MIITVRGVSPATFATFMGWVEDVRDISEHPDGPEIIKGMIERGKLRNIIVYNSTMCDIKPCPLVSCNSKTYQVDGRTYFSLKVSVMERFAIFVNDEADGDHSDHFKTPRAFFENILNVLKKSPVDFDVKPFRHTDMHGNSWK